MRYQMILVFMMGALATISISVSAAPEKHDGLRIKPVAMGLFKEPIEVRNHQSIPGEEIAILRYFKIKEGSYDKFLGVSEQDIWPFAEKMGARVVGMWKVDRQALGLKKSSEKIEEAYLLTRYASLEHWHASRDGIVQLAGNGEDARVALEALNFRDSVTLETNFVVLKGSLAQAGPYFMPAMKDAE
jgi:hypothetical protein